MADSGIPSDASVAVEYRLNGRKFRIDFLIAGHDSRGNESIVIIELKQWEEVLFSELEGHVNTFLGGNYRDVVHPSYQAWSYAFHLANYNEYVYSHQLGVLSCAYLHNCKNRDVISDSRYIEHVNRAPVFIKGDVANLQSMIKGKICKGGDSEILKRIDASPIRPSKQLAEAVDTD